VLTFSRESPLEGELSPGEEKDKEILLSIFSSDL
jgi:hypothetical protein